MTDDDGFVRGFEFDAMARRPLYAACPRWLLERCGVGAGAAATVVDLGCGSGIFTEELLARAGHAPDLRVIAIDPSEHELAIFRRRVVDPRVTVLRGKAQQVAADVAGAGGADAVILCNVLHQIPLRERGPVLRGVVEMLRPGGVVGANTLFYEGAVAPGSETFYALWMLEARDWLKARGVALRIPDETPVALQLLTPGQHLELLAEAGLADASCEELWLDWAVADWEALCTYAVFIRGALGPDVDLAAGRDALVHGVRSAYAELGLRTVRRGWLHCVARRPGRGA